MNEIIKEVRNNKEINFPDFIIIMLYATYFVGYLIGFVKRKIKEWK